MCKKSLEGVQPVTGKIAVRLADAVSQLLKLLERFKVVVRN